MFSKSFSRHRIGPYFFIAATRTNVLPLKFQCKFAVVFYCLGRSVVPRRFIARNADKFIFGILEIIAKNTADEFLRSTTNQVGILV